ncbi:MAG TPA: inorganic diphosphatase [Gemmataceae bacterium]|jgi:inorganic pyrophosphatase|nr:inorganic diphosphatase [Gemmataceae bacterium]
MPSLSKLTTYDTESGNLNVIIETPQASRNKYDYDDGLRLFHLHHVLPRGATFPFDFGFVPSTRGDDSDPLDILVLMDQPAFTGCLVRTRLIGVIEAEQTEEGKTLRNDRLLAVAAASQAHSHIDSVEQLPGELLDEIEHFFVSYNAMRDRRFKPIGRKGPDRAAALIQEGMRRVLQGEEPEPKEKKKKGKKRSKKK